MSDSARRSLSATLRSAAMPDAVECPFCRTLDTEQFSAFGSALSVGQYYCRSCRTVFEWMKRRADPGPSEPVKGREE